jgi:hypothetical protein
MSNQEVKSTSPSIIRPIDVRAANLPGSGPMVKSCATSLATRPGRTGAVISAVLRIVSLSPSKAPLIAPASTFARNIESISQALNQKLDAQLVSLQDRLFKALVSSVQADRFRYLLIRWIVCMHVALTVVEGDSFRELINYICPPLQPLLVCSCNTIGCWIIKEFEKQRLLIRHQLAQANSQIHISFDL